MEMGSFNLQISHRALLCLFVVNVFCQRVVVGTSITFPTGYSTYTGSAEVRKVGDISREKCREYKKYGSEHCAITDVQLIVGGKPVNPKEFAHMALVGYEGEFGKKIWLCGGALISDEFVMIAGHCLYPHQYGEAKYIRLGELVLETDVDDAERQEFNIIQIVKHPNYLPTSRYNDIGLVRLDRKVRLSSYVRPACLQVDRNLDLNENPIYTGWSVQSPFTELGALTLHSVILDYYPHSQCNDSYKNSIGFKLRNGILDDTQICTVSPDGSKDRCQANSGGPIQIVHKDVFCMYSIVGVTSFGRGCNYTIPEVNTRVSSYIAWIESIVWL